MALVAPVLVALLFAITDMGRIFMATQDVATASREAAHYGLSGKTQAGDPRFIDCTGIRTAATSRVGRSGVTSGDVTIQYDHGPGSVVFASCSASVPALVTGDRIVIVVTHTVKPVVPFIQPVTLKATARRTISKRP
jgi:Flp pilus assembly protein TadG